MHVPDLINLKSMIEEYLDTYDELLICRQNGYRGEEYAQDKLDYHAEKCLLPLMKKLVDATRDLI